MEKIRTTITKENLKFLNKNELSVTKALNNFIKYIRIKDELGEDNELQKDIQGLILQSRK